MIAPQTTIGDLILFENAIWWTDTKEEDCIVDSF